MRLAEAVLKAVEEPVDFKFLYDVKVSARFIPVVTLFIIEAVFDNSNFY